jgi:hypothetical protein
MSKGATSLIGKIFFLVICSVLFANCKKSEYEKLVESELSKGVRFDSLFLGLYFGMPRQAFFDRCMELNRQHLTTVGVKGSRVLYILTDPKDTTDSIYVHFYPEFVNDSISKMPVIFTYKNWSPWLRSKQPDSLQLRMKRKLEEWYGGSFIKVERPEFKDFAFVKVDGNRQIVLFQDGEMDVKAVFSNLLIDLKKRK